ncbi:hypothetical protein CYMTET_8200 [Cymbomonas tetramitiformis]|uniref:Uncharacterized protein n=1 Tax=Cymbomonas tetramitiformis TaxID=36881 RepID=A0AAE0LGB2_9CHLO|nr:hypothetical protein CYMTET_8200 [Cymbomonas tetramitiformis]
MKLAFIKKKVYVIRWDGRVCDQRSGLAKEMKELGTQKVKAGMATHTKASAKTSTSRDRQGAKGNGTLASKDEDGRGSVKSGAVCGLKGTGAGRGSQLRPDLTFLSETDGRALLRSLQAWVVEGQDGEDTVRTWLPARHVPGVHAHELALHPVGKAEDTMLRGPQVCVSGGVILAVLHKEKGSRHMQLKRRHILPAPEVEGLVQLLQHQEQAHGAL